jgi:hypothetical protein
MTTAFRTGSALMQREHGVLIRQIAGLQTRVSHQMQAYARQVVDLERALLAARAQLVVNRTALLWGLDREGLSSSSSQTSRQRPPSSRPSPAPRPLNEADTVICQTGCVGHAHPWPEDDGQCRRTGQSCAFVVNRDIAGKPGE